MTARVSPSSQRTGVWIWRQGEPKPYHCYLYARRSLALAQQPSRARIHITASDRYVLYVNGAYVSRGPARSDPRRKSYDTHDVASRLRSGANVIAVRAYHYGAAAQGEGWHSQSGNSYTVGERAGLWAELEIALPDGASEVIGTDSRWKLRPATAWNRDVPPLKGTFGSPEVYDASADPPDWMRVEFDDSDWSPAWEIPPRELDWFLLEPRSTPLLREREVLPTRVVTVGEVIDQEPPAFAYSPPTRHRRRARLDVARLLAAEIRLPLEHARAERPEAVLTGDASAAVFQGALVAGHGIRQPFLVLDFGRQVFGFPRIRLDAHAGAKLDLTYDQLLVDNRVPSRLPIADRYLTRAGEQVWEVAAYRQFRYLHLTVRSPDTPVRIRGISLNSYEYPAERRGAFACADPLLTKLWTACADTVYLNMEDTLTGDAWRERAQWAGGDPRQGIPGMYVAYGDLSLADRLLRSFPATDRGDGRLEITFPPARIDPRIFIPQHLLAWSLNVREHYLFTGRREVAEDLYPSVQRQIDWYEPYRDRLGLLRGLPGWNWLDWAPVDLRGANLATNIFYAIGLEAAAWLAEQLGRSADARRWNGIAQSVRARIRRVFWNPERGLYEDSHYHGKLTGLASEHGNALALIHGLSTSKQAERIAARLSARDPSLAPASPAYFGDVLTALLRVGLSTQALHGVRERFRPMLELMDNPTVWEAWGPFLSHHDPITSDEQVATRHQMRRAAPRSLTHVSAVGAGVALTTDLLGVTPTGPGFQTCRIRPHPGVLDWANGVVPTPHGDLGASWERTDTGLALTAELPDGVEADVTLDRDAERPQTLVVNDRIHDLRNLDTSVQQTADTVSVQLSPGEHRIELRWGDGGG